ncbi:MAG: helicase-associated domain-containing protein [Planctomycetaceae bacterium]
MSPGAPRPRLPDPLPLRKHLEGATAAELEEFRRFWMPHEKLDLKREALRDKLERAMSDENLVYAKVELLSEKVRAILLALLRTTHYVGDLQGLFRLLEDPAMEYYEGEAALTALSRRGFVRVSRERDWLNFGRNSYAIPVEMAEVMRGLSGADRRPFEQVFLRAAYRPSSLEESVSETAQEPPASIGDAIAALPTAALRTVARVALDSFGGILMRHEFPDAFGGRRVRWESRRFRREAGKAGLGTVGHVDLRSRGLGVDDDALLIFHEAVERHFEAQRRVVPEHDLILRAHGDFMSDVTLALGHVQDLEVRVGKEGGVYKAARSRLAESLVFPLQPLLDRQTVADRALGMLLSLGLARDDGAGRLAVTQLGAAWPPRPLVEKVKAAYALLGRDSTGTLRSQHLLRLQEQVVRLLRAEPEAWFAGNSLAMLARNRYLLELARAEPPAQQTPLAVRHGALTELGRAAHDLVVRDLFALGLVEVAMRGQESVAVRLSGLGRRVLGGAPADNGSEPKALVVNPDFELLVLPEGHVDELLHALDRIAVRVRSGEVVHYRLDKERIERATVEGYGVEEILTFLSAHARAPLPQNVEYSVRSWADGVRSAVMARGILFTANDPRVVEAILGHSVLRGCVDRVLGPTSLFFNERVLERQVAQELRALGVYVT